MRVTFDVPALCGRSTSATGVCPYHVARRVHSPGGSGRAPRPLRHANIGLRVPSMRFGADSLLQSLKMVQCTDCRPPNVAPDALRRPLGQLVHYTRDDRLSGAVALDTAGVEPVHVDRSWNEIAVGVLRDVGLEGAP